MQKLDQKTLDLTDENIANIAAMFPHCTTETEDENGKLVKAIDFDLLKQELSKNIVDGPKERYRIDWPGKRASLVSANTSITKTLRPAMEESVDFDTTQNLYIEGDNLEALKLLQESFLGEIKMIYIDPPYNTGNDFVYNDNFTRSKKEELLESGQVNEEGGRLVANLESSGRFHSDWLSMMYPRLRMARNLLKDDGGIFISIDDNEITNLRKICDEVFGEEQFIAQFIWKKRSGGGYSNALLSVNQEYILFYGKSQKINLYDKEKDEEWIKKYYTFKDERSYYKRRDLRKSGTADRRVDRPTLYYEIIAPDGSIIVPKKANGEDGRWTYAHKTFQDQNEKNEIEFVKVGNEWKVYYKERPIDETGKVKTEKHETLLTDLANNAQGTAMIESLFGDKNIFDFPKPIDLVSFFSSLLTKTNDTVLDFFSGSATTAHAVMQRNVEDGNKRKFIMVQLPEETKEKSEAYKAGYKTIAEIGKERIRRAGKKIKEENADKVGIENLDIGFRVLKIDESNMKDIYFSPDEVDRSNLFDTVDHIKEDRTSEDLLFGVLVDWGVDLTLPIRREEILGKTVFFVGHDDLAACFDEELDEAFIKELASRDSMRVVFKENGFKTDETKINTEQIFTQLSPGTDLRVI